MHIYVPKVKKKKIFLVGFLSDLVMGGPPKGLAAGCSHSVRIPRGGSPAGGKVGLGGDAWWYGVGCRANRMYQRAAGVIARCFLAAVVLPGSSWVATGSCVVDT